MSRDKSFQQIWEYMNTYILNIHFDFEISTYDVVLTNRV